MKAFLRGITGFVLLVAFAATSAFAATNYYVAPTGNDLNDGLTPGTAKLTIQAAVAVASATDMINVAAGTYNERVVIDKSLTLQGASEATTILDGTGLAGTGSGITVNGGLTNVTIQDLTVKNYAGAGPNSYAGIYVVGPGNNGLSVQNVTLKDNVGGSGFYANGPVNGVTLNNLDVSGHTNVAGAARGIVIWNGLKQNITITNCDVYNNNCCGIELQDGTASGVTLSNNNIHDNADNGIGMIGLQGPGENLVNLNTLTNNGRFGIEVKNPDGSGAASGAGRIVVEDNTVSRTLPIGAEARDLAGIAAFRRGVLAGNVDIPTGAVIRNNIVSGYVQPSTSEGFGIVAEGTNHTVTGNTVSGCDVGIQRQLGRGGYPGDGDQSNVADTYFGRGNSPISCNITVSGNTLTNTIDTRDVPLSAGAGLVTNLNTLATYCSIQAAVTAASPGDVISAGAGTYNERVVIDKTLTLQGASEATTILDGTGLAGTGSGITVNGGLTNVTIQDLTVKNYAGAGPNSYAGIYVVGPGNNGLSVQNVTLKDNVGGSGFYANGPVNGVTLNNLDVSGHTNVAGAARGIVIWNGLKQNITITNCDVYNNNCCGIELQDGTASGVTLSNNNIHDNADNGIGMIGLQGPGENLVNLNTLTNNGRFGIEVKNPNGSGAASGAGRIVVEDNTVSRTLPIGAEARDLAGIAAFRRGVLAGNVDIPTGAVIRNNIVSGYVQPSTSEGFGIVAEGTNHTVTGNTVSGCDVGIQRQLGRGGYPGDGDQSNVADTYFGRGNSPVSCGITVPGNTLTNTIDTRDVPLSAGNEGVLNTTTLETFCTIQAAVSAAGTLSGHTLEVSPGTYDEQVLVNKGVTIKGVGSPLPTVDFTGTVSGKPTLFDVSADGVTVESMHFNVDLSKLKSAIIASAADLDNITVKNNVIDAYGTPASGTFGNRNAISINYGGPTNYRVASGGVDNIICQGNTVNGTLATGSFFRAGVAVDEGGGTFSGNTLQTISADILVRFGSNGAVNVTNNHLNGGGVELSDMNAGAGTLTVTGNVLDGAFSNVASPGTAVMRAKNNYYSKTTIMDGNTFVNHEWAVSLENYNSVTVSNNAFTPLAGSTTYHDVTVNTKSISTNSATIVQVTSAADIRNNIFNGSGSAGGSAVLFLNHDSDAASFGTFNVTENSFAASIASCIGQDAQSGNTTTSVFPNYNLVIGGGAGGQTTMLPWTAPIAGTCNWYGTTSSAAIATRVGSAVTYIPYLASGVDNDLGAAGFQPAPGTCQYPTTTTVSSDVNPSACGQTVILTATVTPSAATGTVEFFDGAVSLGVSNITLGQATLPVATLPAGHRAITAQYSGDAGNQPSTSNVYIQQVDCTGTATTVVVTRCDTAGWSAANVRPGGTVGITSTYPRSGSGSLEFTTADAVAKADWVRGNVGADLLTTLSALQVELYRNSSSTGSAFLVPAVRLFVDNGNATDRYSYLIWEATYNGYAATFPTDAWTSLDLFKGFFWQRAFKTTPPNRTIEIYNRNLSDWLLPGTVTDGGGNVSNEVGPNARVLAYEIGVGSGWSGTFAGAADNFRIGFNGVDSLFNFEPGTPTTTTLVSDNNPAAFGSMINFTATVSPAAASGTVTLFDGTDSLGVRTLSLGTVTFAIDSLHNGHHSMIAVYNGDGCYLPSTSTTLDQVVVDQTAPQVTVTLPTTNDVLVVGSHAKIQWTAIDDKGVDSITVCLSRDNGITWEVIVENLSNTGTYTWVVTGPPTSPTPTPVFSALIQVKAKDAAGNVGTGTSGAFAIFDLTTDALLSTFQAEPVDVGIELRWQFGSAATFSAVTLERAMSASGPWSAVAAQSRNEGGMTVVVDGAAEAGQTYFYRLQAKLPGGQTISFGPLTGTAGARITAFALTSISPNPAVDFARIDFAVPRESNVRLSVIDVQGRQVAVLVDGVTRAGRHQATWNGQLERGGAAPAGLYFVRLHGPGVDLVRRVALSR